MTKTISFFFLTALAFVTSSLSAQNMWNYSDVNNQVTIQLPANWDSLAYAVKSDVFNDCMESRLTISSGDISGADDVDVTVNIEETSNITSKTVNREGLTDDDYLTTEEEYNKLPDGESKFANLEAYSMVLYQYDSLYEVIRKEPLTIPNTLASWIEFKHYRDLGEGKGVLYHRIVINQIRGNRLLVTEVECREDKWKIYGERLTKAVKTMQWNAK